MITFRVDGIPIPQGSKVIAKAGKKVWLRDANASKLKPWRQRVAAASDVGETFDCPVMVVAVVDVKENWARPDRVQAVVDRLNSEEKEDGED